MQMRSKRLWLTVAVLSLSAEGSAMAQSAPRACSANDPTLECMRQGSASVGPELAAARANLGATTTRGGAGAALDLSSLANRQAAAGNPVANGLTLPSGAGAPIHSSSRVADGSIQGLHGDATSTASVTPTPAIQAVSPGSFPDGWASTASAPSPLASTVIRGQVNPAARSCYENDPDSKSKRPGRLVVIIKLAPTGEIDSVSVPMNVGVSSSVVSCITTVAGAAKFAPPGPNGATVRAAFTFPSREDTDAPAAGAQGPDAAGHAAREAVAKSDPRPANVETARR
jgi:hypothetical protein